MGPINAKLVDRSEKLAETSINDAAAEAGVTQEETVHALVDKWAMLNLGRALMTAIAAISATWATLSVIDVVEIGRVGFASGADRI